MAPPAEPAPAPAQARPITPARMTVLVISAVFVAVMVLVAVWAVRGAFLVPIGVVLVIWVMTLVARVSGRKTTTIPWDDRKRAFRTDRGWKRPR
jgi:fatty acid desaturase